MSGQPGPEATPHTRNRRHDENVTAILDLLVEMYPKTFSTYEGRRRPLKIGIREDLNKALDGAITEVELQKALACYTSNRVYRARLRQGAVRYDLNGEPAGTVSAEHAIGDARGASLELERTKQ